MGAKEATKAVRELEDTCLELQAVVATNLWNESGQEAFEGILIGKSMDLFERVKREGEIWQPVQDLALPYIYTCFADHPDIGDLLLEGIKPKLEKLGITQDPELED